MMIRTSMVAIMTLALLSTSTALAATVYISDELTVPLRSGPSNQHRILHMGLPSGTVLETLNEDADAGFTQIRTQRGTLGWIRSQYLQSEPIAKMKLDAAERKAARLERQLGEARARINELSQTNQAQQNANEQATQASASLQAELDRISSLSANAIAMNEENIALREVNERLKDELDDVAEERAVLEKNQANESLMLGAGFILIGLIAGVLIKARPQRSAWS